jgi:hypothetical protein
MSLTSRYKAESNLVISMEYQSDNYIYKTDKEILEQLNYVVLFVQLPSSYKTMRFRIDYNPLYINYVSSSSIKDNGMVTNMVNYTKDEIASLDLSIENQNVVQKTSLIETKLYFNWASNILDYAPLKGLKTSFSISSYTYTTVNNLNEKDMNYSLLKSYYIFNSTRPNILSTSSFTSFMQHGGFTNILILSGLGLGGLLLIMIFAAIILLFKTPYSNKLKKQELEAQIQFIKQRALNLQSPVIQPNRFSLLGQVNLNLIPRVRKKSKSKVNIKTDISSVLLITGKKKTSLFDEKEDDNEKV